MQRVLQDLSDSKIRDTAVDLREDVSLKRV